MITYTVYRCTSGSESAESGLTPAEVMRHIYGDDGQFFRLDPRMEKTDDEGNETGGEWNVYFGRAGQQWGNKSNFTAYGATEEAAEADFLQDAWDGARWDQGKWIVATDAQHAAEMAAAAADSA